MLIFKNFFTRIIVASLLLCNSSCQFLKPDLLTRSDIFKQKKIEALYQKLSSGFDDIATIKPLELREFQDPNKLLLVDVRPDPERDISIIPGAISLEEFEKHRDLYKVRPIVFYCTIGYRSGKYAQDLDQQGYQVKNIVGGILSWSHIQGELVNQSGATSFVHVYKRKFKLVADGYQAVW